MMMMSRGHWLPCLLTLPLLLLLLGVMVDVIDWCCC